MVSSVLSNDDFLATCICFALAMVELLRAERTLAFEFCFRFYCAVLDLARVAERVVIALDLVAERVVAILKRLDLDIRCASDHIFGLETFLRQCD